MFQRFQFDSDVLNTLAGGHSAIDIPKLNIRSPEAAKAFLQSYGFNADNEKDNEKLWYFHRRALVLLTERLGFAENEIPEKLRERRHLQNITQLLLYASSRRTEEQELQRWSCALIRCMHVYVHSENDLFSSFSEAIQNQILESFQKSIFHDGNAHRTFLKSTQNPQSSIELSGFEVKPFKTSASTVIKLLAKPDALALKVFDKVGVRFITKSFFDSFQVLRFLVEENLISFPHLMPDQSSNNLYPVDLFLEVCQNLEDEEKFKKTSLKDEELSRKFQEKLEQAGQSSKFFRKTNEQSSGDFRFIKFITRKLIHIAHEGKENFSFFYPFEVQIMDEKAYQEMMSGPTEHKAYKERQRLAARKRLFPDLTKDPQ